MKRRDTTMIVNADLKLSDGQSVGVVTAYAKKFRTGSVGFYGNGKAEIAGKRYQVQVQLVEIGTKPVGETEPGSPKPENEPSEQPKTGRRGAKTS